MDLARRRPGTHDAARRDAAADQRPPSARAHRSDEPLLFQRPRGARYAAAGGGEAERARSAAGRSPDERHGGDSRPWRRRHRRGRGSRRAARTSRRPRVRVRHAALRSVLPVPPRPLRHVSIPERDRRRRSRGRRRSRRRHTRVPELAHRRLGRGDGDVRGMGRADLHEAAGRRCRHGVQLRRAWPGSARRRRTRSCRSSPRRAWPSSVAGRSA